jgi:hypothetical protein
MRRKTIQAMRFLNCEADDQIADITLNAGPKKTSGLS